VLKKREEGRGKYRGRGKEKGRGRGREGIGLERASEDWLKRGSRRERGRGSRTALRRETGTRSPGYSEEDYILEMRHPENSRKFFWV
jgi:hypothetical protein